MFDGNFGFVKTRDVKSPERGTEKSAGIDFFIPNDITADDIRGVESDIPGEDWVLREGDIEIFSNASITLPLGVKVRCPDGYSMLFVNKSGVASKKGLIVGACLIDEDYTGIVHLNIINTTEESVFISLGQKAIQGILVETNAFPIIEYKAENNMYDRFETGRGSGGFGSTGI